MPVFKASLLCRMLPERSRMVVGRPISLKVLYYSSLSFLLIFSVMTPGCRNKESYQREITSRGIVYSADSFLAEVGSGNKELTDLFLKAGMDVNSRNEDGYTALHVASANDDYELLQMLVEKGADVNALGKNAYTPLMVVSSKGNLPAVKLLLKKGADVNIRNSDGESALMFAALNRKTELVKLLIEHGADVNAKNNGGITVLGYSYLNSEMSDLLRKAGAKK